VRPGASQPGQGILVARQLDLQARLARVGALGEDVEDDFLAVDDEGARGEFFPIALLGGGEFVVEDDDVGGELFGGGGDGGGLAGADEVAGVGFAVVDEFAADDRDAEGGDEFREFVEEAGGEGCVGGAGMGTDEEGAFHHAGFFLDLEHPAVGDSGIGRGVGQDGVRGWCDLLVRGGRRCG
jgi:hypothetical protein